MEFFKDLTDALNFDYLSLGRKNKIRNIFFKKRINFLKDYAQQIASICFFDSICAVHKYNSLKTEEFQTVKTGELEQVVKIPDNKHITTQSNQISVVKQMFE